METGQLRRPMDQALPFFRQLIERHYAAMLADTESVFSLREDVDKQATVLNGCNHCGT